MKFFVTGCLKTVFYKVLKIVFFKELIYNKSSDEK